MQSGVAQELAEFRDVLLGDLGPVAGGQHVQALDVEPGPPLAQWLGVTLATDAAQFHP